MKLTRQGVRDLGGRNAHRHRYEAPRMADWSGRPVMVAVCACGARTESVPTEAQWRAYVDALFVDATDEELRAARLRVKSAHAARRA